MIGYGSPLAKLALLVFLFSCKCPASVRSGLPAQHDAAWRVPNAQLSVGSCEPIPFSFPVETRRLELLTSSLQRRRSTS
jgi:hypothetical protein